MLGEDNNNQKKNSAFISGQDSSANTNLLYDYYMSNYNK